MGIVYEADDERLGRKVAVKVLHSGPEIDERKRRFAQEAKAASALKHPNIITIYDIDAHDGVEFIVMELVDGIALTRVLRDGPMALDRALDYALQIASALAASHAANIIHRDIKPANIMVTGTGDIKVLDFGLSKWTIARRSRGADRQSGHASRHGRRHQRIHVARTGARAGDRRTIGRVLRSASCSTSCWPGDVRSRAIPSGQ